MNNEIKNSKIKFKAINEREESLEFSLEDLKGWDDGSVLAPYEEGGDPVGFNSLEELKITEVIIKS